MRNIAHVFTVNLGGTRSLAKDRISYLDQLDLGVTCGDFLIDHRSWDQLLAVTATTCESHHSILPTDTHLCGLDGNHLLGRRTGSKGMVWRCYDSLWHLDGFIKFRLQKMEKLLSKCFSPRTNTLTSRPYGINMRFNISGAKRLLIHQVFSCQ